MEFGWLLAMLILGMRELYCKLHPKKDYQPWAKKKEQVMAYFIVGVFAGLFSVILMPIITYFTPVHAYRLPIVSMRGQTEAEGQFFIGCGSIQGVEYYYAMRDLGNNSYRRMKVPSHKVIIIEGDSPPHVKFIDHATSKKWTFIEFEVTEYEFHVPKGTVIKRFKIE